MEILADRFAREAENRAKTKFVDRGLLNKRRSDRMNNFEFVDRLDGASRRKARWAR